MEKFRPDGNFTSLLFVEISVVYFTLEKDFLVSLLFSSESATATNFERATNERLTIVVESRRQNSHRPDGVESAAGRRGGAVRERRSAVDWPQKRRRVRLFSLAASQLSQVLVFP